jgi:hypothetical protein
MFSENPAGPGPSRGADGIRKVTDARTLRALSHPARIALLEALALSYPIALPDQAPGAGLGSSG